MHYGGPSEQAMYGIAWQLNTLIVYTFTPIIALIRREYAILNNDLSTLSKKFESTMQTTVMIVCYFTGFVMSNTESVLFVVFGTEFSQAINVTRLIMIYTIFQSLGQLNGILFISSERTKLYAKLNIATQLITIISIIIFQIPNPLFPNGMGASGIGTQLVISSLFSIPIMGYFNCRYLGINFVRKFFFDFIITICVPVSFGFMSHYIVQVVFNNNTKNFFGFILSGVIYSIAMLILMISVPQMFGISRLQLNRIFSKISIFITRGKK